MWPSPDQNVCNVYLFANSASMAKVEQNDVFDSEHRESSLRNPTINQLVVWGYVVPVLVQFGTVVRGFCSAGQFLCTFCAFFLSFTRVMFLAWDITTLHSDGETFRVTPHWSSALRTATAALVEVPRSTYYSLSTAMRWSMAQCCLSSCFCSSTRSRANCHPIRQQRRRRRWEEGLWIGNIPLCRDVGAARIIHVVP